MTLNDKLYLATVVTEEDENLNPTETVKWDLYGKCIITPNNSAQKVKGEDGEEYIYSYLIFTKVNKKLPYPSEGKSARIVKKDGTINKELTIKGFVTLRNWIKIWL